MARPRSTDNAAVWLSNYGDIRCETASERQDMSLPAVPRPQEVHALIDRERDRERNKTYRGGVESPPAPPT